MSFSNTNFPKPHIWRSNNKFQKRNNYQDRYSVRSTFTNKPKKSGAKYSVIKKEGAVMEGLLIINAWRKTKNGLMTCTAAPYDSTVYSTPQGNEYIKYIAEIHYHDTGQVSKFPVIFNVRSRTLVIKKLNLMITPNGEGQTSSGMTVYGAFFTLSGKNQSNPNKRNNPNYK